MRSSDSERSSNSDQVEAVSEKRNGFRAIWRKKKASDNTSSAFDGNFAHGKPGWWKRQMLVDRSLRSMAGFTSVCAIVMLVLVCCYLPAFKNRINTNSTSVGGKDGEKCSTSESRTIVSAFEKTCLQLWTNFRFQRLFICSLILRQRCSWDARIPINNS